VTARPGWVPALLAAVLAGCASGAAESGRRPEPVPFVDSHVHLNDERLQIELMERYGVERAVVFWGRGSDNESVAAAAARHPGRFVAFASISPERAAYRKGWDAGHADLLRSLDALLASGRFKGIGEISAVHFPSPGLPEADYDPMGPMLEAFPDVAVIWAHGGYTPLFVARRMLERHPNLYYELSARTWPRHPRSPDYTILRDGRQVWPQWLELIEAKPDRFVVGTDASHRSEAMERMKLESVQAFLRQLSPAARARVARTNLLRLLGAEP
jgi:predicted TIM-barrel fold metal-dependent hydrolase